MNPLARTAFLLLLLLVAGPAVPAAGAGTEPVRLALTPRRMEALGNERIDLSKIACRAWRTDGSCERATPVWTLLDGEGALDGTRFVTPSSYRRKERILLRATLATAGVELRQELYLCIHPERIPDRERRIAAAALGGEVDGASPAVCPDGTVCMPDGPGGTHLRAFTADGKERWATETGGQPGGTPAVGGDGRIYVGTIHPRALVALSASGKVLWRALAPEEGGFREDAAGSPAVAPDGRIYAGMGSAGLCAYDPSGALLWSAKERGFTTSTPAVRPDGTILFGVYEGFLYALSRSGEVRFQVPTESWMGARRPVEAPPLLLPDGSAVFGDDGGVVRKVDGNGAVLWTWRAEGYVRARPQASPDGTVVYVTSYDGALAALSAETGTVRFAVKTVSMARGGPLPLPDGSVAVGDSDAILRCLDAGGKELWRYAADDEIRSTPALLPDGNVVVGANDGRLHFVNAQPAFTPGFDWNRLGK